MNICTRPWTQLFADNYKTTACCWNIGGEKSIGSKSTYDNVWNSEYIVNLRENMVNSVKNENSLPSECPKNCVFIENRMNDKIKESIDNENYNLNFKPKLLDIRVINDCNIRCKMCWLYLDKYKVNEKGIKSIISEYSKDNHNGIITLHGGEIFAYDYSKDLIKWISEKKLRMSFISNLNVLDKDLMRNLLSNRSIVTFCSSVDGGCKETYESIRKFGDWELFHDNLYELLELNEELNSNVTFTLHSIIMTSTYLELTQVIDNYSDLPICVKFIPIELPENSYEDIFNIAEKYDDLHMSITNAINYINEYYSNNQRIVNGGTLESLVNCLEMLESNSGHQLQGSVFDDISYSPKDNIMIKNKRKI